MGKLTALAVKNATQRGLLNDGNGLYLQVRPPSGKSWIVRTKVHGRTRDIGIGSTQHVTLAQAREEAQRLRGIARSGGDPLAERSQKVISFADAARLTLEMKRKGWKSTKHANNWIQGLERHVFPVIGERPIKTVTTADVLKVLTPIWHEIPETAGRLRQRMANVFDWAKTAGHYALENPVTAVNDSALGTQGTRVEHLASMPWQAIPNFMATLCERRALSAKALALGILCASRPGEIRGALWSEFDLENRLWTIPAARMKGQRGKEREHRVPLSDQAVHILASVQGIGKTIVFPSGKYGNDRSESEISSATVNALLKRMGHNDITPHGFRTSFRTWAQEQLRVEHEVAEMCLAHRVGTKVSQAYARSDLLEKRRPVMEAWGRYVCGEEADNVVKMHKAKNV